MTRSVVLSVIALWLPSAVDAWDAHAHRCVTYLALDGLPAEAPAWLREPAVRHRIAFQSNQVDRWRGWRSLTLKHENDPDHYIDVELLEQFGLTLETVPPLRREYLRAMAISKHLHPEQVDAYDASADPARTYEWPGFLPHAITEHYAKLQAAFHQVRILKRLDDPARRRQLEQAREIAIYHLGALSHFVADATQPLHTTRHYNGWVGDNPQGFTTSKDFHAYIDGGVIEHHRLTYANLKPHVKYERRTNATDPWHDVLTHIRWAHQTVETLYRLERDGQLNGPAGRQFIIARLTDAAAMLSSMIWSAYTSAEPTDKQISSWVHYNDFQPKLLPEGPNAATQPVGRSAEPAPKRLQPVHP
jgi:hypothetical protein